MERALVNKLGSSCKSAIIIPSFYPFSRQQEVVWLGSSHLPHFRRRGGVFCLFRCSFDNRKKLNIPTSFFIGFIPPNNAYEALLIRRLHSMKKIILVVACIAAVVIIAILLTMFGAGPK